MDTKSIGRMGALALVVGNMIGAGIFLLPTSLANLGAISLVGWIVSSIGALYVAKIFSDLSKDISGSGGPYRFTRVGFGDFAGFWVAWGYWIAVWTTNAALAIAFVSYTSYFIPTLAAIPILRFGSALFVVWLLIMVHSRGIKTASNLQILTTALKVIPLIALCIYGAFFLNPEHFFPFNASELSPVSAIASATTLTLFAFLGIECATIPSSNIRNPESTVPWATKLGTLFVIVLYICSTVVVMGLVDPGVLKNSNTPFADAAQTVWGNTGAGIIAFAAMISTFGALNGWILVQGELPKAAAIDGLFPRIFMKSNSRGVPLAGLVLSGILISILMSLNLSESLSKSFEFIILISTLATLIPYLFCSAVYLMVKKSENISFKKRSTLFTGMVGILFSIWAIIGSGMEVVYWGFVLLAIGIPVYVFVKKESVNNEN